MFPYMLNTITFYHLQADVVIAVADAEEMIDQGVDLSDHFEELVTRCGGGSVKERVFVVNKSDLLSTQQLSRLEQRLQGLGHACLVSCQTEDRVPHLVDTLAKKLEQV